MLSPIYSLFLSAKCVFCCSIYERVGNRMQTTVAFRLYFRRWIFFIGWYRLVWTYGKPSIPSTTEAFNVVFHEIHLLMVLTGCCSVHKMNSVVCFKYIRGVINNNYLLMCVIWSLYTVCCPQQSCQLDWLEADSNIFYVQLCITCTSKSTYSKGTQCGRGLRLEMNQSHSQSWNHCGTSNISILSISEISHNSNVIILWLCWLNICCFYIRGVLESNFIGCTPGNTIKLVGHSLIAVSWRNQRFPARECFLRNIVAQRGAHNIISYF
jgi:hypothetical protein